jgi:hypothetical protein
VTQARASQEAVSFHSPDELRSRPGFRSDIVATGIRPRRIVGGYRFDQSVRCGVKGCAKSHQHGYVVQIAEGIETNTGWDCALDHFGIDFLGMRTEYDRLERETSPRAALHHAIDKFQHLRDVVHTLQVQPHGGNWLLRNLRRFRELYPASLLAVLVDNAERGEIAIYDLPIDPGAEQEPGAKQRLKEARRTREKLGGLRVFSLDVGSWPLFAIELELSEFLELNPWTLPLVDVTRWCQWAETLEARLAQIEALIDEGKIFFRRGNLELLRFVAPDRQAREQIAWIVNATDFAPAPTAKAVAEKGWQRQLRRIIDALNS